MRNHVILLIAVFLLYLVPSVILQTIYGPSYGFLSGEDCWQPDDSGGWVKHGYPTNPPPTEPSVLVPVGVRYVPIFLAAAVLVLFLFTPLSKKLETKRPEDDKGEAVSGGDENGEGDEEHQAD
ncbi:MAG: hypothetical protein KAT79_04130 [candidate division Zixibacteria bacterium]|nr:hypothetical protein [candidate division Zixibacteria bacterium]